MIRSTVYSISDSVLRVIIYLNIELEIISLLP